MILQRMMKVMHFGDKAYCKDNPRNNSNVGAPEAPTGPSNDWKWDMIDCSDCTICRDDKGDNDESDSNYGNCISSGQTDSDDTASEFPSGSI
jgi:hypothetical protein